MITNVVKPEESYDKEMEPEDLTLEKGIPQTW